MAVENRRGYKINAIEPGLVETRFIAEEPLRVRDSIGKMTESERPLTEEEVGEEIAFLASTQSEKHGQVVPILGPRTVS